MGSSTFAELSARGSLVLNDGYRTKSSELALDGIPILRVSEIGNGYLAPSSKDRIDESYRKAIGVKLSRPGDVLLTTKGTVGRRAIVPSNGAGYAYSPQVCFFRVTDESIDPRWLYYWLGSAAFWEQATAVSTQTDMAPYISLRDLRAINVDLPPIDDQRAIAATLGALDDKIESNERLGRLELELAIALLSTGTEAARVGDVADVRKGLSYKGSGLDDGSSINALPMLNLANFTTTGALKADGLKHYTGDYKARHRLAPWDLVTANTDLTQARELLGRGFLVPPTLDGALHTHHTSKVDFFARKELRLVLWAQLQTKAFRERAKGFATGTTVTALPAEAILDFVIQVPNDLDAVLAQAHVLIEHSWYLGGESAKLARTRDVLSPELLSGRTRIPLEAAA